MLPLCLSRAVILLLILSLAAAAQAPAPDRPLASNWDNVKMLAPGTQLRVADDAANPGAPEQIQGTLESVTDSELVIVGGNGTRSFPRAQIVGVSVKKKERRLRNALIGLGVGTAAGAGVGFGIGHAQDSQCTEKGGWFCGLDALGGVVIGSIIGIVGGTLTGVFWPTGGWRKIYTR